MSFDMGDPAPLPSVPRKNPTDTAVESEMRRRREADGFQSTIRTSPLGVTGQGAASTSRLLGVAGRGY